MAFPKYVYKRGTAKPVGSDGLFTADSALVKSEEELKALEGEWCSSPAEAGTAAETKKTGHLGGSVAPGQAGDLGRLLADREEPEEKHSKKVK